MTEESPPVEVAITVEGMDAAKIATDASNLVVRAADLVFRRIGRRPARLCLHLRNAIPVGSGLGSSSAAILGGMLAANALVNGRLSREELLLLATELEGHPDNIAPALYGGLVLGVMSKRAEGQLNVLVRQLPLPPLQVVVVLPDFSFSTTAARALLPQQVAREDAIFNSSRLALLIHALRTADYPTLRLAMQDRLHQPFRLPLIPGSVAALEAAYAAGAAGVALSGAGPALLAFVPPDNKSATAISQAMALAFSAAGMQSRSWTLGIDTTGCQVTRLPLKSGAG
jgi:homoserine kinase